MQPSNDNQYVPTRDMALLPLRLRRLPLESFKIVTKPGVHSIREAMDQASWLTIAVLLAVLLLLAGVVDYIFYLFRGFFRGSLFEAFRSFIAQPGIVWNVLALPFFMLVSVAVLHMMARLLGRQGAFLTILYTNLLFQVPLVLLTIIISAIPLEGEAWLTTALTLVLLVIQLYVAVLQVFALRAVYDLSQGRAVICVLALAVLSLPLTLFLGVVIL
jgi:Yip1 domain